MINFVKKIPFYIFFDLICILASYAIESLYEKVEIWFISYFFIYLLFCVAIFLKQYDLRYLAGLQKYRDMGIIEWGFLFTCMLFPGWLAGPALLGSMGYIPGEISYSKSVIPLMAIYPMVFYIFPFRKSKKINDDNTEALSKNMLRFLRISTNTVIIVFTLYLEVFYFYIISSQVESRNIPSSDGSQRFAMLVVSMLAMAVIYLPARIHYFFEYHGSLMNKISFFITVILIALYSMTGMPEFKNIFLP